MSELPRDHEWRDFPPPPGDWLFCPNCGHEIRKLVGWCVTCKARIGASDAEQQDILDAAWKSLRDTTLLPNPE